MSASSAGTARPRAPRGAGSRYRIVVIGVALIIGGLGAAVLGAMSTFTIARTKPQNVSTGTFAFVLSDPASAPFSTDISGLAPGDFADRLVDLVNTGQINYSSVALSVSAPTSSALDSDAVNGLQVQIAACSVAWTQASSSAPATCSGATTVLTALTPLSTLIAGGPTYTSGLVALTGGTDHLRFHYSLPTASTGTAGLSSVLSDTFTATQANGGAYH